MNYQKIIETLIGGKPLSFRRLDDGSVVVINSKGQKLTFTGQQVKAVEAKIQNSPGTYPKSQPTKGKV